MKLFEFQVCYNDKIQCIVGRNPAERGSNS